MSKRAKTISSREFNQDVGGAKRAAQAGPVFITDRGRPAHVLMNIADYRALVGGETTLMQALAQASGDPFEFAPPKLGDLFRAVELP
jgi:prevent-host-death family protein